jgi:hypothetical protein
MLAGGLQLQFGRRTPFLRARGTARWSLKLRAPRGRYRVLVRVTDVFGNVGRATLR